MPIMCLIYLRTFDLNWVDISCYILNICFDSLREVTRFIPFGINPSTYR